MTEYKNCILNKLSAIKNEYSINTVFYNQIFFYLKYFIRLVQYN